MNNLLSDNFQKPGLLYTAMSLMLMMLAPAKSYSQDINVSGATLTLNQAIEEALANNPNHQMKQNNHLMSLNNEILGTTRLFPTLDARAKTSYADHQVLRESGGTTANGDYYNLNNSVGLGLNWVLFDGFQTFNAKSIVEQEAKLSEVQLESSERSTILNVKLLYAQTSVAYELYDWWKSQYAKSQSQFTLQDEKWKLGALTRREWLKAKIQIQKDSVSLAKQAQALQSIWGKLSEEIGRDISQIPKFEDFQLSKPASMPDLNIQRNVEYQALELQEEIAIDNKDFNRGNYYPKLVGFGNYDYYLTGARYTGASLSNEKLVAEIGLALSWNLFDGLQSTMKLRNSSLQYENAKIQKTFYEKQIENQYKILLDEVEIGFSNLKLGEEQVLLSEENLKLTEESYKAGSATRLEYEDALQESRLAMLNLKSSELSFYEVYLKLEYLVGAQVK